MPENETPINQCSATFEKSALRARLYWSSVRLSSYGQGIDRGRIIGTSGAQKYRQSHKAHSVNRGTIQSRGQEVLILPPKNVPPRLIV